MIGSTIREIKLIFYQCLLKTTSLSIDHELTYAVQNDQILVLVELLV
jgi:hypothetical protein